MINNQKRSKKQKTIVMSLGGSIICPDKINIEFLKEFKNIILKELKENNTRFILICGGGMTARNYISSAKKLGVQDSDELDWMGIHATYLNASIVKTMFKEDAYEYIINNPTTKFEPDRNIIVASGWKPGFSTDMDAVLLAKQFNADTVLNVSNIDYVYSADPKKDSNAIKIDKLTWKEYLNIIGEEWIPGKNAPFDPVASKEAMENNITVRMITATIENIKKYLETDESIGTIIKN